jgi:hypothetical protein
MLAAFRRVHSNSQACLEDGTEDLVPSDRGVELVDQFTNQFLINTDSDAGSVGTRVIKHGATFDVGQHKIYLICIL